MKHGVGEEYSVDLPQVALVSEVVIVPVSSGHISENNSPGLGVAGLQLDRPASCIYLCCVMCACVCG